MFEAKGRTNGKEPGLVTSAKAQTRRLGTICSCWPVLRVASIVHFPRQSLHVHLEDPDEINENAIDLNISENQFLQDYYEPFISLFSWEWESDSRNTIQKRTGTIFVAGTERRINVVEFEGTDVEIGLEDQVYEALRSQDIRSQVIEIMPPIPEPRAWLDTEDTHVRYAGPEEPTESGDDDSFLGPDGVFVRLGESWSTERMRLDPRERRG